MDSELKTRNRTDDKIKYRDCTISITSDYQFSVASTENLEFTHRRNTFASLAAAKEAIDTALKLAGVKAKRKVFLPVLNEHTGERETIHGIHSRNGNLLGLKNSGEYNGPDALPPEDWIAELIDERQRLQRRVADILKVLRTYALKSYRESHLSDPDAYGNAIAALEAEYAEKCKLARELNDRPQVVYRKPAE